MITTFSNKNTYGGYTHEIELLPYLKIRLTEMDATTTNIELVEKRVLRKDVIHFSFISHAPFVDTVINAFEEIIHPKIHKPTIEFNIPVIEKMANDVFFFMEEYQDKLMETSIIPFKNEGIVDDELSKSDELLFKALQAYKVSDINVAQELAFMSLQLNDKSIEANLFYFQLLFEKGHRSLKDFESNRVKAIAHFKVISDKLKSGVFVFNDKQKAKWQDLLRIYGEFLDFISERRHARDGGF